jgi:DNA-binding protein YbaB
MTQQMQKQLEEKAFQEKIAQIFHNINSIDELITVSLNFELK